jgi:hypothetical protein
MRECELRDGDGQFRIDRLPLSSRLVSSDEMEGAH